MIALVVLLAATANPAPAPMAGARTRLGPLADRARGGNELTLKLPSPSVRIGIGGDGKVVSLSSPGGFFLVDRNSGRAVWRHIHKGMVRVVLERGAAESPPVFRVQVASLSSQEEAEALAERASQETGEVAQVSRNPDRNAWRVRVGRRGSREELAPVEEHLRGMGFSEIWVVQEPGPGARQPRIRLVDEEYHDLLVSGAAGLLALPAATGKPLRVNDQPYRGVIEILVTPGRDLQAVNILGLEEYLRGVVPREMGPTVYPELEALKAQAVAARTYLEANRGQFSEDGFDICDTARCQVYGGMAAEHPLTDFAVDQTAGLVAMWQGRPINALYTSTCGGHTEDVGNVFREMKGAYLKGVLCYPENALLAASRRRLTGVWVGPAVLIAGGERIDEALVQLEVLDVIHPEEAAAAGMESLPEGDQTERWTRRTLKVVGKEAPPGFLAGRGPKTVSELAGYLADAFSWTERAGSLIAPGDFAAFLSPSVLESTPEEHRPALAYLVREGILPRARGVAGPGSALDQGSRLFPGDPISKGLVLRALHRMIVRYEATSVLPAKHRGFRGDTIGLQSEGATVFHTMAARLHLMLKSDEGSLPVAEHLLQDGDNLEYHLSASGEVDYLSMRANQRGASDDRFSNLFTWETRISKSDLETRIRQRASIGKLVDLVPGRRGPSGRLIDLAVIGSAGRFTFHGFNIERLLGLRETLFLIDRQKGPDGNIETFIFSGKGWGHGVGLCQVGAYGMALRGKSFEEILHHYYDGIDIRPLGHPSQ